MLLNQLLMVQVQYNPQRCFWKNSTNLAYYWLICIWVWGLSAPMCLGLDLTGPLCPISNNGSPVTLLKFQMATKPKLLTSTSSKKKEPRYACLSEVKASHSQRMWAEVSSLTAHFLHKGLSSSPSRWRCLLRVLWPVRRPVTALDWVLLNVTWLLKWRKLLIGQA